MSESDQTPDDPDGGIGYRVVGPDNVPDTPDAVAALVGVDYVTGAACARERAEAFVAVVEAVTGTRVLDMRPRVSPEGRGSAMVWLGAGTMKALTVLLTGGRAGAGDGGPESSSEG